MMSPGVPRSTTKAAIFDVSPTSPPMRAVKTITPACVAFVQ